MKKGRSDKCDECGKIFKSAKAKSQHMTTNHSSDFPGDDSLIETKIQCTLCNLKEFTLDSIKDHLSQIHFVDESDNWESYIGEVGFEMNMSTDDVVITT